MKGDFRRFGASRDAPRFLRSHRQIGRAEISANAFDAVFRENGITVGIASPVRSARDDEVDLMDQLDAAIIADDLGFAAYWVRDVPLNGPWYPETIGHLDPFVALGVAAATTRRIALGTAATVLSLRHPLHVAKAAASLQVVSGSRLLLGLGAGDRPEEFAAFGSDRNDRSRDFRDNWQALSEALLAPASIQAGGFGYEMRPSDFVPPPMLAVGSGGQTLDWIARNARAWFTYHREPDQQRDRHGLWRRAVDKWSPDAFRGFAVAMRLEVTASGGPESVDSGYRTGLSGVAMVLERQRDLGVHHLLLHVVHGGTDRREALEGIADAAARVGAVAA